MKKRLLFVMESLGIGGAEKSLITLLSQLDYTKYEVDLFLFEQKGEFMSLLSKEVNLLSTPKEFEAFIQNPISSFISLLKMKKLGLLLYKIIELINLSFYKFILNREYIGWDFINKSINTFDKEYDVAIGFLEKKSVYLVADRVRAKKKIGWIHTDYSQVEHNHKLDCKKFNSMDKIITVSEHCRKVIVNEFPIYNHKIEVIENSVSNTLINKMANEKINDLEVNDEMIIICTVARLTKAKGIDIAIECCSRLCKNNINLKWIVIGEGSERENLNKKIYENGLKDKFILMGSRVNPYPYIKKCDVYVQPSIWEGFGITVAEAKVLKKPIVVNNIPEFIEQIEDNKTGLVYRDIDDMVYKIEKIISSNDIQKMLINGLNTVDLNNQKVIDRINNLFIEVV